MKHHLLAKPVKVLSATKVEWECACGLRVALPPQQVPAGTAIKVSDKYDPEIVECAACYAGVDEKGELPPPVGAGANERQLEPTFDTDLGVPDVDGDVNGTDDDGGEVLAEEDEEFPG
jgi:hypothetical protein